MTEPILAIWPTRAQLRPGEPLALAIHAGEAGPLVVRVFDGTRVIAEREVAATGPGQLQVSLPLPTGSSTGYGIEVASRTEPSGRATTAIDVASHWSAAPRYGFFADFAPGETPEESTRRADDLLRLHVNVVQFYDWMASHHTFLPETEEFTDPLGRRLSHEVVRRKIALARERGMAALAYGALYGAEADFSLSHPDWLLYDGRHEPLALADIFYLQDFGPQSPWREWIIGQYEQAVDVLGFDGIHIDQYGYPKRALSRVSGTWQAFDAGAAFPGFVEEAAGASLTASTPGRSTRCPR
jgi:dextranase